MKTFEDDFLQICKKLVNREPFAFNRFSDGELYILQNKELILDKNVIKIGEHLSYGPYKPHDFKHFDPSKHAECRKLLIESFRFTKKNYYKGICCACCINKEDFKWQIDFIKNGKDEWLTWSNLLVNSNYSNFINIMFPQFFNYKTVILCNEKADLFRFPFIVKDFRIGYNAMINNYSIIDDIKRWIFNNKIKGHLFLFSASVLSKIAIHQLYKFCDENTYIDIGTTITPLMNLGFDRSYLRSYWLGSNEPDGKKICIWKEI
jgi:hypothetical protein